MYDGNARRKVGEKKNSIISTILMSIIATLLLISRGELGIQDQYGLK